MATLAELWEPESKVKSFTDFPLSRGVTDTHKGMDYAIPLNTPITAATSGIVKYKTNDPKGYGNAVEIVDDKGNVLQRYAHLNKFSVPDGSKIEPGQVLGLSGSTGKSTGPHLHFEDFTAKPIKVSSKTQPKQTGETLADLWDTTPAATTETKVAKPTQPTTSLQKVVAVQKFGQQLIGQFTGIKPDTAEFVAKDLAAKFDNTVGSVLPFFTKKISQASTRFLGADKAAEISDKLTSYVDKPVGKAFGITNDPTYQNEALGKIMSFIGENKDKGDQWIANNTGLNKNDVQFFTDLAAIKAGEVSAKATGKAATQIGQQFAEAKKEFKPSVTIEPSQPSGASVGAAAVENKTLLDQAKSVASPELRAELEKVKPENINPQFLNNQLEADSLGIQLTEGQATGNPILISKERNERGYKEQFVNRFNEQNKTLMEKTRSIKDEVAPDVFSQNYVVDADNIIANTLKKQESFDKDIGAAYKELEDFGKGKIEVDSQTFGLNARKALLEKDDIDFLPASFKTKLQEYIDGKPMNFNQFENLRSQTAREIRKEQRADNGNAVHALTLFRGELEKLPLIGETAEAKVIADQARNLAKNQFDLLDKRKPTYNSFYADIVNGKADSSNFISKSIINAKNADFVKTLEFIGDDPITKQHIASGTLDLIIDKSTDASGNFMTKKFKDYIDDLDTNGKLQPLFGEQAETLRKIARTGQLIEARPRGAFVNESNTFVAQAAELAKSGLEKGANVIGGGILPIGTMIRETAQARKAKKTIEKSLKPGAGVEQKKTKLKDFPNLKD